MNKTSKNAKKVQNMICLKKRFARSRGASHLGPPPGPGGALGTRAPHSGRLASRRSTDAAATRIRTEPRAPHRGQKRAKTKVPQKSKNVPRGPGRGPGGGPGVLQLMWLQFEVARGPVEVVWGRFGAGLGPKEPLRFFLFQGGYNQLGSKREWSWHGVDN